jgi:hypothetical protein
MNDMGENTRDDIMEIMTEDLEENPGEDIIDDMMEDIDMDRSNRDTIGGFREYGDRLYQFIDHRLWDIPINISDTFVYLVSSYDPGSSRFHILLHHPRR